MWSNRTFIIFSTSNSCACRPAVANRTISAFFTCRINRWEQPMLFLSCKVMIRKFYSILLVRQNNGLLFWHRQTKSHSYFVICRKEKYIFIRKRRRQLSCVLYGSHSKVRINMLFWEVVLRSGKLNWNNPDMPIRIAMSCILWKQPKKFELWQWIKRKNS